MYNRHSCDKCYYEGYGPCPIHGPNNKINIEDIKICENCGWVWGRRGWRQLGIYDG